MKVDFSPMPPKEYILQITDDLTTCYIYLWEQMRSDCHVVADWDELTLVFHKSTIKRTLRILGNAGLLNIHRLDDKGLAIELVGWDDIQE